MGRMKELDPNLTNKRFACKNKILYDNKYKTFYKIEDSEENINLLTERLNDLIKDEPLSLNTHILKEDYEKIAEMIKKYYEGKTESKRFEYVRCDGFEDNGKYISPYEVADLLNKFYEENKQLKQQINDFALHYTENYVEFDKDELYVKDTNTEIELKNGHMVITVFVPQINQYSRFNYYVTGRRRLMKMIE